MTYNIFMHYDLVVIGGGPAGNEVASYAIRNDWKVAIFEERAFGGTCLNVGCIPSKGYLHRAKLLSEIKKHRVSYDEDTKYFSLADLQSFTERTVGRMAKGIEQRIADKNIDIYKETVVSFSEKELETSEGTKVTFDKLIIACGTKPAFPGKLNKARNLKGVYTNENIFQLKVLPSSMTVIGGGAIGVEMAYFFASYGVKIDLVEATSSILAHYDEDIVLEAKKMLKKKKIKVYENILVKGLDEDCKVTLSDELVLENDVVLIATGRQLELPSTNLNFETNKGFLKVDETFQTTIDNIYAVGDANGISMFAHSATDQGKQLGRFFLKGTKIDHNRVVPSVVYTSPAIASVGVTEKAMSADSVVKKIPYDWSGRAHVEKETVGFIKLIIKESHIVGAHIIGAYAEEMIALMNLAVQEKTSLSSLRRLILAHPTYGELFLEGF